jgi:Ca2+-binding RTX toxin-like protein
LTYSLDAAPSGANIDPLTGLFTWPSSEGPTVVQITVRVTDDGTPGLSDTETFTITVNNVAPTAIVAAPFEAVRGQGRTFVLTATDPSPVDQAAGFTFRIDWDGNGTIDETVVGPSGVQVERVFPKEGANTVRVTAVDKDGGVSGVATHSINVAVAAVQADALDPAKRVLVVGGSTGDDKIDIKPEKGKGKHADEDEILVKINEKEMGRFKRKETFGPPIDSIIVYGQAGDDKITVDKKLNLPAQVFGDEGDDKLSAGGGPTTLVGGEGDDDLEGGEGRNVLIGGRGEDRLLGKAGDDLLIAGLTFFDDDLEALSAIMAEWGSDRDYYARIANLRGDESSPHFSAQRANGNVFLKSQGAAATVFDDGERDKLTGSSGCDWFFAMLEGDKDERDKLTDLLDGELVDELP